jgi:membrane protease YdiL (CAAX protease family)
VGYGVFMAINAFTAHILPAIVVGLVLRSKLTPEPYLKRKLNAPELVRLFIVAYGFETLANFATMGIRMLISFWLTGEAVADNPLELIIFGDTPVRLIVMLASVCVIAPIFEELIFRGFFFRALKPYGALFGGLVSAAIFGIYHASVAQLFYAMAVGSVFSYVVWRHGMALLPSILLHMAMNVIGALIMVWTAMLELPTTDTLDLFGSGNMAYDIASIALLCMAGFGVISGILYFRRAFRASGPSRRERSPLALSVKSRLRALLLNPLTIIALVLVVHAYLDEPLIGLLLSKML